MSRSPFPALRVEGGLLARDLITRVLADPTLPGRAPGDYYLASNETVREAAARAFDYLSGAWTGFTRELGRARAEGRPTTGLTRESWLLPLLRELGYGMVPTTPAGGLTVEDTAFPVSHRWGDVPIHLLGADIELDHRTRGVAGAARAPQSMVQELLNRSEDYLWAIVANGPRLRLLRDSRALAGSAYVEFDLELIFTDQLFSDFLLLFRLAHASRLQVGPDESMAVCWLERWRQAGIDSGQRALEQLQAGVEAALISLGTGFLRHPANSALRDRLRDNGLSKMDYKRAVLRLVYRLLFWFVADDRDVLLDPGASAEKRERYRQYFGSARLRERARRGGADHHDDLWEAVRLVFAALGTEGGEPRLALPGIGGLFDRLPGADPGGPSRPDALDEPLEGLRLANDALVATVHQLAIVSSPAGQRPVDFRNLGAVELGSVYEGLLEQHPVVDLAEPAFGLDRGPGNERKETGSYYTPEALTDALLDSALDPVLTDAARSATDDAGRIEALLSVTVCDPACGSGHFLVAAARRIARRVAQLRAGESEPAPELVRTAMREVVARCIHGVDVNEMAVELTRVSLWLESVEPGAPLPFLDANIRVGNSLLGTTPALIDGGIPDAAFAAIEGDSKDGARIIARVNRHDAAGQLDLLAGSGALVSNRKVAAATESLVRELPERLAGVAVQQRRLRQIDAERAAAKRVADAWCAAFVQPKTVDAAPTAITTATLGWIGEEPATLEQGQVADTVEKLAERYGFFHWHVEFPHIFPTEGAVDPATGWRGGFTCVLGNPPWERVKLQEKEFFAAHQAGDIANARNAAARKQAIAALETSDSEADRDLFAEFTGALRHADGWSHLLRDSGRYPLAGRGDINTYAVFAETGRTVLGPRGRVGMVLPTGIATDATTQHFFADLVNTRTLASVYDFENEEKVFPAVHHSMRFCLWTAAGPSAVQERIELAFRLRRIAQLAERRFTLAPAEITLLNPNTGTLPVFDFRRNAEITLGIYRRVPVLWREQPDDNPWAISFQAMLHMSNDAGLFRERDELEADGWELTGNAFLRNGERMLPLYEAKMVHQFDDRFGTYAGQTQAQANVGTLPRLTPEQKDDPAATIQPRYWVPEKEVTSRLARKGWDRDWLLGWRNISRTSDTRTLISAFAPLVGFGNSYLLILSQHTRCATFSANLDSFVTDFAGRQKLAGTNYTYNYFKQLPVLPPERYEQGCPWTADESLGDWVTARVVELVYTSDGMAGFAADHGDKGRPFWWDEERRFWLRAELDAAYFHLYGVARDDVDYVMDTFRAFRNNDPDRFARTKAAILDVYDRMATVTQSGQPYRTVLDPPPAKDPAMPDPIRAALLLHTCLAVLSDAGEPMPSAAVIDGIAARVRMTDYEAASIGGGRIRWEVNVRWYAGSATRVGWMTKRDGLWAITDAGETVLARLDPDGLMQELKDRYRETERVRAQAMTEASGEEQRIAQLVSLVDAGAWTSFEDVGQVVGLSRITVADFLAAEPQGLIGSYRVLEPDGSIPPERYLNRRHRGLDVAKRLASEGLQFDPNGRAAQEQRMLADDLSEQLAALAEPEEAVRRAWLVRGSSVDGVDLVVNLWLREGFVSLAAGRMDPFTPPLSRDQLKPRVDDAYSSAAYSVREAKLAEFDAFTNRMRIGDTVLTVTGGNVFAGEVTGPARWTGSEDQRSNLRRPVTWRNPGRSVNFTKLPLPLPARLQNQADVVELTDDIAAVDLLLQQLDVGPEAPSAEPQPLTFPPVTPELADDLLMPADWLADLAETLFEQRQVILYGPPGTGKTYLARKLAAHLSGAKPETVRLVQFHASYTYEDFFEGFRPVLGDTGRLDFTLSPGPFRRLVDAAKEHPSDPYLLLIDEVNRADLAKVFGELYFLLEYRNDPVTLMYSGEQFVLPANVFVIGTMNTADRSIALLDAALRRRFSFVELHPAEPPTAGLLRAWLARQPREYNGDAADLLDRLNQRIEDRDLAIGPSYFMHDRIYERRDGLDRVWRSSIRPLLEEQFYGSPAAELDRFGLDALRKETGGP